MSQEKVRLLVTVEGGIVQSIDGLTADHKQAAPLPAFVHVEVWDFDTDHEECEDCDRLEDGTPFHRSIYDLDDAEPGADEQPSAEARDDDQRAGL